MSEFLLLLVYYAEAEVNFVGLFKAGLHAHHLGEGFFRMLKRTVAVVENANAVPKLWFLDNVRTKLSLVNRACDLPWDQIDGRALAGRPSKPVASHPSSDSNALRALVTQK